jgi:uncharacterized RDD family membrane protein YckC
MPLWFLQASFMDFSNQTEIDGEQVASFFTVVIVTMFIQFAVYYTLEALYYTCFTCSSKRATPGKMALGLTVVGMHGQRISFWQSLGRHIARYLSALILCIGFLIQPFTKRRQALHDLIAETLVLHSVEVIVPQPFAYANNAGEVDNR